MAEESTALATTGEAMERAERPSHALMRPVVSPAEMIEVQKEVHQLIAKALEQGRDYGVIPGTDKPTLLKPGAERIGLAFGTYPRYSVVEQEVDHNAEVAWVKRKWKWGRARGEKVWTEDRGTSMGVYRYVIRCEIVQRATGQVVGDGIGSASTLESKYVDRPRDLENTVLKMAQKRAFVAATLNAYALSDRFSQDMEDIDTGGPPPEVRRGGGKKPDAPPAAVTKKQIAALEKLAKDERLDSKSRNWIVSRLATGKLTEIGASEVIERATKNIAANPDGDGRADDDGPPPTDGGSGEVDPSDEDPGEPPDFDEQMEFRHDR